MTTYAGNLERRTRTYIHECCELDFCHRKFTSKLLRRTYDFQQVSAKGCRGDG